MKTDVLLGKIQLYIAAKLMQTRGEEAFLSFFVEYLAKLDIPHDREYDHWQIDPYLPEIIAAAHEEFRTSKAAPASKRRLKYEQDTGHGVPNLTDIGESSGVHQVLEVLSIAGSFGRIMTDKGGYISRSIETYCNAQSVMLQQAFDVFSRRVYQKGLFGVIRDCEGRGMNGKFGKTWLRSYVTAGRIMFTFCRKDGDKPERQVSFVGEDTDPLLLSAGIQSVDADIHACTEMIMDVVKHWPSDALGRKSAYVANKGVKLDAVVAMEKARG